MKTLVILFLALLSMKWLCCPSVVDPFRCQDGNCLRDAGHDGPHFKVER